MIDREIIMDCAQRAGFGGVSRSQLYTRLSIFAQHIATWNTAANARVCDGIGDDLRNVRTEFADGQMDGAYKCAEALRNHK